MSFQQRMVDELTELGMKIDKLSEFIHTDTETYSKLIQAERDRLRNQLHHMTEYYNVLRDRIGHALGLSFESDKPTETNKIE